MLTVSDRFSFETYRFLLSIIATVQAICKTGPFCSFSHHKTEKNSQNQRRKEWIEMGKKITATNFTIDLNAFDHKKKRPAHKIRLLIRVRFHANLPFHVIHAIQRCFIGLFVQTNDIPNGLFTGIRNKNANQKKNTK